MKELRCSECGGELHNLIYFDSGSQEAEMYNEWNKDFGQCICLSCYCCGEIFKICRASVSADISEIKGLYDFDRIDRKAYELHKRSIAANRSCFSFGSFMVDEDMDNPDLKQWIAEEHLSYIESDVIRSDEYPF